MSQFFASGGQSIGVSASASALAKNIQDWFPLGWTGWISLQSKGLSRVFSNTTVQKHQFFGAQFSSESNSHIHTLTKAQNLPVRLFGAKRMKVNSSLSLSSFLFPSEFLSPYFLSSSRQKQNSMHVNLLPPAHST